MTSREKQQAFSLIELMVTLVVLAILSMLATPTFVAILNRQNLNKSVGELIGVLHSAKTKARFDRREIHLKLNVVGRNDGNTLYWAPYGNAILHSGQHSLIFMPNGLVKSAQADLQFILCDHASNAQRSTTISISRLGVVQSIVEGQCG